MSRLGKKQLDCLAMMAGVTRALVVPDPVGRSLLKRGMMTSISAKAPDSFLVLTPAGYRAIADALENGDIVRPPLEDWNK